MKKLLILAALAATASAQPALADPAPRTILVQHADLDLQTATGAKALQHRVWRAVVEVCGTTSEFDVAGQNDIRQCRRDTLEAASTMTNQVIAGATRSEPVRVASARN